MLTREDILKQPLPPEVKGLRVTVLGLARSGLAATRLLHRQGARVFVSDAGESEALHQTATALQGEGIAAEVGQHSAKALACDLLVRSPGVPNSNVILQQIRAQGIPVVSEVEVACWYCQAPVVAITGSNGKTTTTEWLGDVFRRSGRPVAVCGNVGYPFAAAVASVGREGVVVLEISSFQLEDVIRFAQRVAVITNFSPDHLDRYDSYEDYIRAKCRIFENMTSADALVYNRGDQDLTERIKKAPARLISFGRDPFKDQGASVEKEWIIINSTGTPRRLLPSKELALPGKHNLENALALACVAADLGVPDETIVTSLKRFPGVAHRLENVMETHGVLWVNDSKATNIASGMVALESYQRPIILLAGGRDKGSDFSGVAKAAVNQTRLVILFGEAGPLMERAWMPAAKSPDHVQRVTTLEEAVKVASVMALPGEVVLLSPMCASFDEFKNYEDRGEKYKIWVRRYAESA